MTHSTQDTPKGGKFHFWGGSEPPRNRSRMPQDEAERAKPDDFKGTPPGTDLLKLAYDGKVVPL